MIGAATGSSAFTAAKARSTSRLNEAKEELDAKVETLASSSKEAIQAVLVENATLKERVAVLEANLRTTAAVTEAARAALKSELASEKERRLNAECERDYLVDALKNREVPYPDLEAARRCYSPGTFQYTQEAAFTQYNAWQQDWNGYIKVKAQRK